MNIRSHKLNLLSSNNYIQIPFVCTKIGSYTFGIATITGEKGGYTFNSEPNQASKNSIPSTWHLDYPSYVKSLNVEKINGQVNKYTLTLSYPITPHDDPNFIEKVLSSVSKTRKIIFTYGDWARPNFIFKEEEALITSVQNAFDLRNSIINYTISAVSTSTLSLCGSYTFPGTYSKPSDEIIRLFNRPDCNLKKLFTGMDISKISTFIDQDDRPVQLETKTNISALDYLNYLVSCMVPAGTSLAANKDIYLLSIHDSTAYDRLDVDNDTDHVGPYFTVKRVNEGIEHSDAYEIDIGYNTSHLVTNFQIENQENYSMFYDYQTQLDTTQYTRRLTSNGTWEDVYTPSLSSKNGLHKTKPEDAIWWTKLTQYPIKANITLTGLIRPAQLMTYIRLNVIFPGGNKHISSGLYLVTKQVDNLSEAGYLTTLSLVRIAGDNSV